MNQLFLPYELALMAKEKGFDEPCMAYYNDDKILCIKKGNPLSGIINQDCHRLNIIAPLYQQLIDWFREKHNLIITIDVNSIGKCFGHYKKYNLISMSAWSNDEDEPLNYYDALNKITETAFKLI
jgi:hypothetical protein